MKSFWARELSIDPEKIICQEKGGVAAPNRHKNGTFKIVVHDTQAKARLNGFIDYLMQQWEL